MKYLIIILFSLSTTIQAQSTLEAFIGKISEMKLQQCVITHQEVSDFEQSILVLQEELNVKLEFLYVEAELESEKNEEIANAFDQMSEEEQQKYIDQVAAQKKLTQKNNTQTIANNATRLELMNKQKSLSDKIRADQLRIEKRYTDFENDTIERKILFDNISKWEADLTELMGIEYGQAQEAEKLSQNIKEAQIKLCDENATVYQDILIQHFSMLKSSIEDYRALEQTMNQLMLATGQIQTTQSTYETTGMKLLNDYLNKLRAAYFYKLYFPEDEH
jgi:rubrerythrin